MVAAATAACAAPLAADRSAPTVFAGSSLAEVVAQVDPAARASFGASSRLEQQIRQGAPFDVFLSASPTHTQALYRERLVRSPVVFATNALVLIVPRANPARIGSVQDLARRPTLRLVLAAPSVPIGGYTREALRRLGLSAVLGRVVSLEPDVKGIVGKVVLGEADAGFVYTTDVRPIRAVVRVIRLPASAQPEVVYEAAIATHPRNPATARAFLEALLGSKGRASLRAAGFGVPR